MIGAYSPVPLLIHSGARQFFGADVTGHHAMNVVLHSLGSVLLAMFLVRCGISRWAAGLGSLFFLVHPANVEAVAWISQLKTSSCFVLALLALLAHPRKPYLGLVLFALALLAKPTAATALFVLLSLGYTRSSIASNERSEPENWRWPFVVAWGAILLAYAPAYIHAFSQAVPNIALLYEDYGVHMRSVANVGLRYLVMACSGYGTGAFHQPSNANSLLDPWWLASLPVLTAMVWRVYVVWRRGSVELVFWVWAASWYVVISGIIPLPFPLADRHLYFILPGLIGIGCIALPEASGWLLAHLGRNPSDGLPKGVSIGAAALLAVALAAQTHEMAGLYGQPERLYEFAAERYPEGTIARQFKAREAALRGDVGATMHELRGMRIQYGRMFFDVLADPTYGRVRQDPRFDSFMHELARAYLAELAEPESQLEFRQLAFVHMFLGDIDAGERAIRKGLELDGPISEQLRADLEEIGRARTTGQF
jgi:hypothetical protein